jgi:hypothetical protein
MSAGDSAQCFFPVILAPCGCTKKTFLMKKQTGIWLDLRNAYLINLPEEMHSNDEVEVIHLSSEIEETSATGGTRSKAPWGPQGGDPQRTAQERRHHEEGDYFEVIINTINPDTEELVLFGPSEAKHGLNNAIGKKTHYQPKIMGVEGADQMTQHQMVAWVRTFFNRPAPRHLPKQ